MKYSILRYYSNTFNTTTVSMHSKKVTVEAINNFSDGNNENSMKTVFTKL